MRKPNGLTVIVVLMLAWVSLLGCQFSAPAANARVAKPTPSVKTVDLADKGKLEVTVHQDTTPKKYTIMYQKDASQPFAASVAECSEVKDGACTSWGEATSVTAGKCDPTKYVKNDVCNTLADGITVSRDPAEKDYGVVEYPSSAFAQPVTSR